MAIRNRNNNRSFDLVLGDTLTFLTSLAVSFRMDHPGRVMACRQGPIAAKFLGHPPCVLLLEIEAGTTMLLFGC